MTIAELEATLHLPSPLERISWPPFDEAGLTVWIKRDDLIHPQLPGNKWRKLRHNLLEMNRQGKQTLLTVGGAFSNHLAAVAYAAHCLGIRAVGIVRGEDADLNNPVLRFVREHGMELNRISRSAYSERSFPRFSEEWCARYPEAYWLPEGGSNEFGVTACRDILAEVDLRPDWVICPVGSGTTLAGLALSLPEGSGLLGFPAIKGGHRLMEQISMIAGGAWPGPEKVRLVHGYDFGGFGRIPGELTAWMAGFTLHTGVPLDPVYTAKMMFGLSAEARAGTFPEGSVLLVLHTGGFRE